MTPTKEVMEALKMIENNLLEWRPLTTIEQFEVRNLKNMVNRWFNEMVEHRNIIWEKERNAK